MEGLDHARQHLRKSSRQQQPASRKFSQSEAAAVPGRGVLGGVVGGLGMGSAVRGCWLGGYLAEASCGDGSGWLAHVGWCVCVRAKGCCLIVRVVT